MRALAAAFLLFRSRCFARAISPEKVGNFTAPYDERVKLGKPVIDRESKHVRVAVPDGVTRTAVYPGTPVRGYEAALDQVKSMPDNDNWKRLTSHQLFLALDIAKKPGKLRSECLNAIKDAPERPGFYFLLARADAEEGNSEAARVHLRQAFDRRNNHLPGELFPDPSTDEFLVRLKANREFWEFVETLSAQLKNGHADAD